MAFTTEEETKLRAIISAFEGGQQIDDLPLADSTVQDKEIEVFDKKTGASGRMSVRDAVNMSNSPYCGRCWNLDYSTPAAATWVGSLDMLRNLPDILGLGCYLVKNDHSRRKLDPTNHYRFANGETAKLDGSMGHYQWGWGKKFYIAFTQSDVCSMKLCRYPRFPVSIITAFRLAVCRHMASLPSTAQAERWSATLTMTHSIEAVIIIHRMIILTGLCAANV